MKGEAQTKIKEVAKIDDFKLKGFRKYFSVVRVNPYSAGIDFRRQNLTSVDVRFWRLKSIPAL